MLRKDISEHTALAVVADSFETALTEVFTLLQDDTPSVLVIIADDPLFEGYPTLTTRAPFTYALALAITKGEDYILNSEITSVRPSENSNDAAVEPYWSSLEWVHFLLPGGQQHAQYYASRNWHWRKNARGPQTISVVSLPHPSASSSSALQVHCSRSHFYPIHSSRPKATSNVSSE